MKMSADDRRWADGIKRRAGHRCEWCGVRPDSPRALQAAHVFSRKRMTTRHDPDNGVCLCAACHFRAHAEPTEFAALVRRLLGQKAYDALRRRASTTTKAVKVKKRREADNKCHHEWTPFPHGYPLVRCIKCDETRAE